MTALWRPAELGTIVGVGLLSLYQSVMTRFSSLGCKAGEAAVSASCRPKGRFISNLFKSLALTFGLVVVATIAPVTDARAEVECFAGETMNGVTRYFNAVTSAGTCATTGNTAQDPVDGIRFSLLGSPTNLFIQDIETFLASANTQFEPTNVTVTNYSGTIDVVNTVDGGRITLLHDLPSDFDTNATSTSVLTFNVAISGVTYLVTIASIRKDDGVLTTEYGRISISGGIFGPPASAAGTGDTTELIALVTSQMASSSLRQHNSALQNQIQNRLVNSDGSGGAANYGALDLDSSGRLQGDAQVHSNDIISWLRGQQAKSRKAHMKALGFGARKSDGLDDTPLSSRSATSGEHGEPGLVDIALTSDLGNSGKGDGVAGSDFEAMALGYASGAAGFLAANDNNPALSLWTAGGVSTVENTSTNAAFDAQLFHARLGLDTRVGNALYGIVGGLEWGDADIVSGNTDLISNAISVAGYVAHRMQDLIFDGSLGWAHVDYSVSNSTGEGSFTASRFFGTFNITGVHEGELYRALPTIGLIWLNEDQASFTDSNGTAQQGDNFGLGRLSFGGDFYLRDPASPGFEPYVKARGEWDFMRPDTQVFSDGTTFRSDEFGVVLGGGIKAKLAPGSTLHVEATADALAREDTEAYSGKAEIRIAY